MGAGGGSGAAGFYDAALHKREAMMGKSGPAALWKNFRVFRVAAFACIGGVLYGYNQGMFSGVLAMNSFNRRRSPLPPHILPCKAFCGGDCGYVIWKNRCCFGLG